MAGAGVVAEAAGAGLGEESFTDEELGMQIFRQEERWRWPWWCGHRQVEEEASAKARIRRYTHVDTLTGTATCRSAAYKHQWCVGLDLYKLYRYKLYRYTSIQLVSYLGTPLIVDQLQHVCV